MEDDSATWPDIMLVWDGDRDDRVLGFETWMCVLGQFSKLLHYEILTGKICELF